MISEKTKEAIFKLQALYPKKRSALIPALHLVQNEVGYLPLDIQSEVADLFGIEPNEVNAVVTFYDMFYDKPVGKHLIHVCKNVSCMLRGSDEVIGSLCQKLKVDLKEVTEDGEFTVFASECLGACDKAPMMLVDDEVIGPIKLEDLDKILADAKKGPGHPSPVDLGAISHG
ncbi:NADH-quinone oxidoreductase subunit NuoE [Criblamydia sequanensis]|uniref:NADH-quinone oxidoreductase subunit E n=1 Tax=Candidatus Criblamydia sequanensis CRIB-18 TaxID=1437425 RepID=A0A090CYH0_9BACT|nr:NADH-quinone oxidoreductase subunit NuoE [Criblamydia sequanensis]CDR33436.1 NADH-quinone oxidoreductase subunit E [Criblamydia sequanensis CRIB-18]